LTQLDAITNINMWAFLFEGKWLRLAFGVSVYITCGHATYWLQQWLARLPKMVQSSLLRIIGN